MSDNTNIFEVEKILRRGIKHGNVNKVEFSLVFQCSGYLVLQPCTNLILFHSLICSFFVYFSFFSLNRSIFW